MSDRIKELDAALERLRPPTGDEAPGTGVYHWACIEMNSRATRIFTGGEIERTTEEAAQALPFKYAICLNGKWGYYESPTMLVNNLESAYLLYSRRVGQSLPLTPDDLVERNPPTGTAAKDPESVT